MHLFGKYDAMVMFRLEASLPQFSYALHSLDDLAIFKVGIPYCSKAATTSHFSPVKETSKKIYL